MADCDSKPYGRVYLITNKVNGKRYIGQTVMTLAQRFSKHLRSTGCAAMHAALKKYGADSFLIEELAVAYNPEELNSSEESFISAYGTLSPNGYNLKTGGGSRANMSQATREKMRGVMLARWQNPQYRSDQIEKKQTAAYKTNCVKVGKSRWEDENWRTSMVEKLNSPEVKKKQSALSKSKWVDESYRAKETARRQSPEAKEKASLAGKKNWADPDFKRRMAAVLYSESAKEKHKEAVTVAMARPETKEKLQAAARARWDDRNAMMVACQSVEAKEKRRASLKIAMNREGVAEKRSADMKAKWADPEFRAKMLSPERTEAHVRRATGRKHTPEMRAKMSADRMGREVSLETRIKISKSNQGRIVSQETRAKIAIANTGRVLLEETKEKLRQANLGKKAPEQTIEKLRLSNPNNKSVICIESGEVFISVSAAARHFGMKNGNTIGLCCRGKVKTADGYHFEYTEVPK